MKKILTQNSIQIKELLIHWFEQNLNRNQTLIYDDIRYSTQQALLAAALFKRGVSFIKKKSNSEIIPVPVKKQNSPSIPMHFLPKEEFEKSIAFKEHKNTFLLIDKTILKFYPEFIQNFKRYYPFDCSEENKNFETVLDILNAVPESTTHLWAIGGGTLLDISGFAAGLLELPINYIATTLLCAIDAALGGKTGVNFYPYGKNQLGLFVNPQALYVCPEIFATLPSEEILCALGESLKHAWLQGCFTENKELFEEIYTHRNKACPKSIKKFVALNYSIKSSVVSADPYETGIRAILNFGHTIGHILEGLCQKNLIEPLPHGIAVAYGIRFLIENNFVQCDKPDFLDFLKKIMIVKIKLKLNTTRSSLTSTVMDLLQQDKKNNDFSLNSVSLTIPKYGFLNQPNFSSIERTFYIKNVPFSELTTLIIRFIEQNKV
ncbi:MAG: 3-dehydroquinate synthase [Silvanigrellaceae bacterium]|nr:3-dehydroquinate synthase [Silvanigrellaceae bacterium]